MSVSGPGRRSGAGLQLLVKISLSVLFGLLAFVTTELMSSRIGTSTVVGIAASVFIAGVAFVTQFLVDVAERVDALQESMRTGLNSVNEATRVLDRAEASGLDVDTLLGLVHNASLMSDPPLLIQFAEAEIARLSGYLREIGQVGSATYEGEDRDWLLGLTRTATASMDAMSFTTVHSAGGSLVDGGLWATDLGVHYLSAQAEAVRRGVAIRRVFSVERAELLDDPEFHRVLGLHRERGVQVRTLTPEQLRSAPLPMHRSLLLDFIVFDEVLCYEANLGSEVGKGNPTVVTTTRLLTDHRHVNDRIQRFNGLWEAAQEVVTPTAP